MLRTPFSNQLVPETADLDIFEFKEFAFACDKYNCLEAVSLATEIWLDALLPCASSEALAILEITYLLNAPSALRRQTKELVINSVENFLDLAPEDGVCEYLPFTVDGELLVLEVTYASLRGDV